MKQLFQNFSCCCPDDVVVDVTGITLWVLDSGLPIYFGVQYHRVM